MSDGDEVYQDPALYGHCQGCGARDGEPCALDCPTVATIAGPMAERIGTALFGGAPMTLDDAIATIADEEGRRIIMEAIASLRADLEWARDPSGVVVRAGHERKCAHVRYPYALYPCNCEIIRGRRRVERERLEAGLCIRETGSWTGPPLPGAWLAEGRRYCDGLLGLAFRGGGERQCYRCEVTYTAESFALFDAQMPTPRERPRAPESAGVATILPDETPCPADHNALKADPERWVRETVVVGVQEALYIGDVRHELRNCRACGSTLTRALP